jgi:uncharacterized membrane protein YqjE
MAQQQVMVKEEKSLGDLFSELASETSILIRQEVTLAKTEVTAKAALIGKDVGFLALGGAAAYIALLAVVASVILLLAQVIPAWLSALIVGVVIGGGAYFLITSALTRLSETSPLPERTIETLKEDAEWLKKEMT